MDQFDGLLAFQFAPSRNHHFGSRLREKYGGIAANTRGPASHEPNFAFQFRCHKSSFTNQTSQDRPQSISLSMKLCVERPRNSRSGK